MTLRTAFLSAFAVLASAAPQKKPSVRTLGQLDAPAFFENIAVRPSGSLLATLLVGGPDIYTVVDPSRANPSFELLTSIPAVDGLTGITEILDENGKGVDRYVVTGGNSSTELPNDIVTGSWSAWEVAFDGQGVTVDKISGLSPETVLSNGVAAVPNAVLLADSARGAISRLDLATGAYEDSIVALPEMLTTPDSELGIGINGVKVWGGQLYFSNTATASIWRFPVTEDGYPTRRLSCSGPELVANITSLAAGIDDFEIDARGDIYATTNYVNLLVKIDGKTGDAKVVAGGAEEFTVAGASAAAFGRTKDDKRTLYMSTATATIGNVTEGGRVLAVEL